MMVSDVFLPFLGDGIDTANEIGVTTSSKLGGSVDQECIDAADEHGISMLFTGQRLFFTLALDSNIIKVN